MPVVARVLLHEVLPHPPHRGGHLPERECVVQLRALQCGIDGPALGPVDLEVLLGAGRVCLCEVRVRGIGAVVQVGYLLTAEGLPDPPALGVGQVPDLYYRSDAPDADFEEAGPASAEEDFERYRAECRAVDAALEGAELDDTFTFRDKTMSVRWMWQHLVEEYARHNGHADLLREVIDGSAGL